MAYYLDKINRLKNTMARLYLSYFPIERGKWRFWVSFLKHRGFREIPSGVQLLKHGLESTVSFELIELFAYYWRCWEPNETWAIRRLLRPGDVSVDVGAKISVTSPSWRQSPSVRRGE